MIPYATLITSIEGDGRMNALALRAGERAKGDAEDLGLWRKHETWKCECGRLHQRSSKHWKSPECPYCGGFER